MLKRVKKWLGIEGVKFTVEVPEEIFLREKKLTGRLIIESRQESDIRRIKFRLIEKYSRGRGQNRLIDEYILGESRVDRMIHVEPGEPEELVFDLPFDPLYSEMDRWESNNLLMKGMVKTAKFLRNVKSQYRLEIEPDVAGMAISPLIKKEIKILRG